mgnify:CR=1 FL=1
MARPIDGLGVSLIDCNDNAFGLAGSGWAAGNNFVSRIGNCM